MKKTIGTAMPLSALWSDKNKEKHGNLDTALLFLDWLHATGQTAWQLLPLHETQLVPGSKKDHVPSPYKGYGVGLDPSYLSPPLKRKKPSKQEISSFVAKQNKWLPNHALFCALRDHFGTDNWTQWEADIRKRDKKAITTWRAKLKKQIDAYILEQWQLHHGFQRLRDKARKYNIQLIGDLSFYIPLQSSLVWQFQNLFQLSENGEMKKVSGLPDGPKAHFGRQIWGHPLYNWKDTSCLDDILTLWKRRLDYTSQLFDIVRLDHAKGFFSYGSMHRTDPKLDTIEKGPGVKVLKKIITYSRKIGLELFAEDSGDRLKELRDILHSSNVPGIRVLRFAYNEKRKKITKRYANMSKYPIGTFAQSTTHDTETLLGYLNLLSLAEKKLLSKHCKIQFDADNIILAIRLREALILSPAHTVIIPIQDWLITTNRINIPGTEKKVGDTNWQYRVSVSIENLPPVSINP
ncbi:4-alpha-glucanotransferase [Patescibacteria group bacterium]